ncbi:MAG: DUF504 domain-containing protein [Methylococcales bacterium]|nr:DUF504 domain-containing protein [Methylococcales bacterium]
MIPIQDLLHRIRWDPEFGCGEFVIGYYDRIEHEIILVPFREIRFPKDGPGIFELVDHEGQPHSIPLHRVKSVYKNGELIWHRE